MRKGHLEVSSRFYFLPICFLFLFMNCFVSAQVIVSMRPSTDATACSQQNNDAQAAPFMKTSTNCDPDDDAESVDDAEEAEAGDVGATTVNMTLNGEQVQPNALPSWLNGQNPFSYFLVKGKPIGATKLTKYSFLGSSNAFQLKSCNPMNKPFSWGIKIDPASIPQNVVLMATPDVNGGQQCAVGVTGPCKKASKGCYAADVYSTAPTFSDQFSSQPEDHISSWTVNMCQRWVYPAPLLSKVDANGQPDGWLYNLPTGGVLTATASFGKTLPLQPSSVTVSIPTTSAPVLFNPGQFNLKYNGASGSIPGVSGSWSLAGMQLLDMDSTVLAQCLGQNCVVSGVTYNYPCFSRSSWYIYGAYPTGLVVYFYNNAESRPTKLPSLDLNAFLIGTNDEECGQ